MRTVQDANGGADFAPPFDVWPGVKHRRGANTAVAVLLCP